MTENTIFELMAMALIASGVGVKLWQPKEPKTEQSEDKTENQLKSIPARYFYCVQNRDELPEPDPMRYGEEIYRDSEERVGIYMGIDFPLALGGGDRELARAAYMMDNRNFTHLSATLNERIRSLANLGLTYPDVLQIRNKIIALRERIDNESEKRNLICATNLFPQRFRRAYRLIYKDTPVYEREDLAWTEVKVFFSYKEEDLLF
jgi:hypothetical protein